MGWRGCLRLVGRFSSVVRERVVMRKGGAVTRKRRHDGKLPAATGIATVVRKKEQTVIGKRGSRFQKGKVMSDHRRRGC